ncbi:MAG: hypothetical protein ABH870_02435, partial [bacterium]
MAEDRFDEIREILAEVTQRLNNVAREHELFDKEMRKIQISQEELQASQKKTDKQLKETSKELGGIGGGLGRAAEGLTAPSVP